ncbi:MAG: DNA alkylation repair protein [Prevotellaceae bacterium]|nr:DNA alkylation repair protein [Prevotellaceae bacterium]
MEVLENEGRRKLLMGFFKTGAGQYGEGDKFLGLVVPETRAVVKAARELPMEEVQSLLKSPWHEVRLCGLLVLVSQFEKAMKELGMRGETVRSEAMKRCDAIADFYVKNAKRANNWDLVDMSCYKILGRWLLVQTGVKHEEKVKVLDRLAMSDNLWERRISMVSTMATTMAGDPSYALKYAELHLRMFAQKPEWSHDLMHKAVGWMLREVGKRCDMEVLRDFLSEHAHMMPRTSLRYAIEKMNEDERRRWMSVGECVRS